MRRPHWRDALFTAISGAAGLALLAACTSGHYGLSARDQMARYLQNARGNYVIPGPPSDPWGPYIREASARFDMPETWIRALMRQESGGQLFRGGRLITSSAGAMGLMQVMPGTYAELRARHNLGPDPFDPHENIMAGVAYMREMYDMYGSPGFLAAYNAGPNRLDDYLSNQRGLPDETRRYVAAIGPSLAYGQPRRASPAQQYAMNQLPLYIPPGTRFGYGATQLPTVQVASAAPAYRPPVFTAAATQPTYAAPAPQPRAVAWAEPPRPVYTPPAAPAYAPPAAPAYAPPPTYAPPPRPTVVARAEDDDDDYRPVRHHTAPRQPTRVALAIPASPPSRRGGGFHLISSAMAAEVIHVRRGGKAGTTPVSYHPAAAPHASSGAVWKLHSTGPVQAAPGCHKGSHGKTLCGARI
jgi:hypothetical protein